MTGPSAPRVVVAASPQIIKKGRGWRLWTHLRCEGSEGSEGSKGSKGSKGGGIALSGDEYEVSVTDSPFCVIWHSKHSGD